ncbi:MAG: hypothetical protein WA817_09795 [Candidatus Acidiferrum sp.]
MIKTEQTRTVEYFIVVREALPHIYAGKGTWSLDLRDAIPFEVGNDHPDYQTIEEAKTLVREEMRRIGQDTWEFLRIKAKYTWYSVCKEQGAKIQQAAS